MFFNFQVLLHTLFFFLVMELAAIRSEWIAYVGVLLMGLTIWGVNKIGKGFVYSIIPTVFSLSAVLMIFLIDSPVEKNIFSLLCSGIFYLALFGVYRLRSYQKDQTARGMVSASALATLFFFYAASYGIYLNFSISLWVLMTAFLIVTTLVSYEYFGIVSTDRKTVGTYSLILGMLMAEIAWVINFWPFGYLSTGAVVTIFYYIFWDLTQTYFFNTLSQKRLIANVVFFSLLIILILSTSRWLPVV
jgi:hypothetical protein